MEKFTKRKVKTDDIKDKNAPKELFKNDHLEVVEYEDWTVVKESDSVVCIPFLIETNQFIIRQEYIPSYKLDEGIENHITVLSGTIEDRETPSETLKRELEEEAGIVLRDKFEFEFERPLFRSKNTPAKYHYCIVPLTEMDYHEIIPSGDGSKAEKKSKCAKVSLKYLNSIIPSDTITELMLCKFKEYIKP